MTVAASDAVDLDVASLTFTTEDWATPQTVTVTAAQDPDAADEEAAISHTASGGGYQDVTAEVSVPVDDDETVGLRLSSTELDVNESATATYTVQLESPPTETVKVRVWRSSSGVTLSTTELTFTSADWSSPKTVTVTGADDNDSSPEAVTLTHRSSGAEYDSADTKTVEVTVSDDDTPGVMVDTTSVDLTEGGTATYTVVLQTQPSAAVAVALTLTGSDDVAASPETLRFTDLNWDIARTVTVTGLQDDDASDEAATVGHTASGGGYDSVTIGDVSVAVDDDDTPSVTLTDTSLTLREGTSAVYAVVLDTEPSGPVTVTLTTTGSADVSVSPTTLTFTATNWEIAKLVTVSAAQDADTTADQATVSHSASGGDYGSVTVADVAVTVTDGEAQGVTITPITLSLPEGSTSTYSVVLTAEPTDSVTVTPSVSGSSDVVALPSVLTFTTTDWATAQIVTVTSTADADASDDLTIVTHALSGGGYDSTTAPDVLVTVGDPVGQPILDAVRAGDGAFRGRVVACPSQSGRERHRIRIAAPAHQRGQLEQRSSRRDRHLIARDRRIEQHQLRSAASRHDRLRYEHLVGFIQRDGRALRSTPRRSGWFPATRSSTSTGRRRPTTTSSRATAIRSTMWFESLFPARPTGCGRLRSGPAGALGTQAQMEPILRTAPNTRWT